MSIVHVSNTWTTVSKHNQGLFQLNVNTTVFCVIYWSIIKKNTPFFFLARNITACIGTVTRLFWWCVVFFFNVLIVLGIGTNQSPFFLSYHLRKKKYSPCNAEGNMFHIHVSYMHHPEKTAVSDFSIYNQIYNFIELHIVNLVWPV